MDRKTNLLFPDRSFDFAQDDIQPDNLRRLTLRKIWLHVTYYLSLILLLALPSMCMAQQEDPEQLFNKGNGYYEQGDYQRAIEEYEKVLSEGVESGVLYFNLGNAYLKAEQPGKAILNYIRAGNIMPRDSDLNENYRFARTMLKGQVVPERSIWEWRPLKVYSSIFSPDELTLISAGTVLFVLVLMAAGMLLPRISRKCRAIALILIAALIFNVVVIRHKVLEIKRGAVITTAKVEALFGPFDSATKFFTVNEGMRVIILTAKDDWYKIERADGKVGWIKKDTLEKIQG